jgi:hypothetical protein
MHPRIARALLMQLSGAVGARVVILGRRAQKAFY